MPQAFLALAAVVAAIVTIGAGVIGAMKMTAPVPAVHAAIIEACNGPVEMAAVEAADPTAAGKLQNAQVSSGQLTPPTGASPLPIVARVVGSQYVVTVGSGSTARTCQVPIGARSL